MMLCRNKKKEVVHKIRTISKSKENHICCVLWIQFGGLISLQVQSWALFFFSKQKEHQSEEHWRSFKTMGRLPTRRHASVKLAAGLCPRGDPRSSTDSNSIKVPFICRGGPSNRLGREREAEKEEAEQSPDASAWCAKWNLSVLEGRLQQEKRAGALSLWFPLCLFFSACLMWVQFINICTSNRIKLTQQTCFAPLFWGK